MEEFSSIAYQNHVSSSESEDDSYDPPLPARASLDDQDFMKNLMKKIVYSQGTSLNNPIITQAEKTGLFQPSRFEDLFPVFIQVLNGTHDQDDLSSLANGIKTWKVEERVKLLNSLMKEVPISKLVPFLTTLLNMDVKLGGLDTFVETISKVINKEDVRSYTILLLHVYNTNLVISILNKLGRSKYIAADSLHQLIINILRDYEEEAHQFFAEKEKGKKKKTRLEVLTEGWDPIYEQALLGGLTQNWTRKQLKKTGITHHISRLPKEFSLKAMCALKILQLQLQYSKLPKELRDYIDRQREVEYYKYFEKKKGGHFLPYNSDEENASDLSDYLSDSEGENWRNILSKRVESDTEDSLIEPKVQEPVPISQLFELRRAGEKQKYWTNLMLYYQQKEGITMEVELATKFSKFEEFVRKNKILGDYEQFRNWMNQRLGSNQRKRKLEEIDKENRWNGKRQKLPDFNWYCSKCGKKKYFIDAHAVMRHSKVAHKGEKVQALQDMEVVEKKI